MTPLWGAADFAMASALHWDGLNSSLKEVLISSAIGNGASKKSVDLASLDRIGAWLKTAAAAGHFRFAIDRSAEREGRAGVRRRMFATCHAPDGARMGQVIPIDEMGTDRHRLDTWTAASASAFNAIAAGKPWQFKSFRKTTGTLRCR